MSAVSHAESIPPHLSAMTAQIYQGIEKELSTGARDKQHQKTLEESVNFLKKLSVHRWSRTSPKIDGGSIAVAEKLKLDLSLEKDRYRLDKFIKQKAKEGTNKALHDFNKNLSDNELNKLVSEIDKTINDALKKVSTLHLIEDGSGRSMLMQWKPETGRFLMKVSNDSKDGGDEFISLFSSDIKTSVDNNGKESLTIQPSTRQIQIFTATDIEEMRINFNILGEWTDNETGEIYTFTAAEEKDGEIIPPRESFDKKINQRKEKIQAIQTDKIYEWKNKDTNEVIKQSKFRSLKEPFKWVGEKYAMDNAQAEISNLEQQIADLIKERDGGNLSPRDKHDPGRFNEVSNSKDVRPIAVRVKRADGYSYTYDMGVFDGLRIRAKRTYRDVRDIENLRLPKVIRHQAIDKGWNPSGWLELDASIDTETGDMVLEGDKWALHVTYSSFMGSSPEISSIHTPFPIGRKLVRNSDVNTPELKLVRVTSAGIEQIYEDIEFYGGPYYLEAIYRKPQNSSTKSIKWERAGHPEEPAAFYTDYVIVYQLDSDPNKYRSREFYLFAEVFAGEGFQSERVSP